MLQQFFAGLIAIIQLLLALLGFPAKDTPEALSDYPCVFVHGLGGWATMTPQTTPRPIGG